LKLIACLALLLNLSPVLAYDVIQYAAEIDGQGTIYSDVDGQYAHTSSYVRGGDYVSGINLNESGATESMFAGFATENVTGYGSFKILQKANGLGHQVQVTRSKSLSAQVVTGVGTDKFVTRYDISGSGNLQEMLVSASTYGRPNYMRNVIGNGTWQVNESILATVQKTVATSIFDSNETENITNSQTGG